MSENHLLIYINHLENIQEAWRSRFCDLHGMDAPDYVISPFECAIELTDFEPGQGEKLFELRMDVEAKSFTRSGFCTSLSSELMANKYAKLSETVHGFSLAFPNYYMLEAGLRHKINKQQNRLDVNVSGDLRLKLTNVQPNIHELI